MNHSTDTFWTLRLPETGFVFDVGSLYDRFERLTDRRDRRGKRYPLAVPLMLLVPAKPGDEDEPHRRAEWVRARASAILALLPVTRRTLLVPTPIAILNRRNPRRQV